MAEESIVNVVVEESIVKNVVAEESIVKDVVAEAESSGTIDIMVNSEKVGWCHDGVPDTIHTDEECRNCLQNLRSTLKLECEEIELVDQCIAVVSATCGDDVVFGPCEILALGQLAQAHPSRASDIIACSHHITESIEWEGELPSSAFLNAAQAYTAMGEALTQALQDLADEEFDEPLTDEDE